MAIPATRVEIRLELSHACPPYQRGADASGLEVNRALVLSRHPSETAERVTLRALAWCVLYEEALEQGPGLCDGDAPDLVARDARGDVITWIACGNVTWDKARRALSQNPIARVVAFATAPPPLLRELAAVARPPKGADRLEVWTCDPALVRALASDARRQRWTVTVVEGHVYVDADGASHDGPVTRCELSPAARTL
jgi:uncharacterized protein YaeQ